DYYCCSYTTSTILLF
nr:immunoglobulin light chain junction region [Macaca mulatta]MOX29037.1 immunoglobulin light chain junction region [Macaca mulatta]MOX29466.1 immunoglobulin light chain junction region [Macaca mulatta]MOX29547.1 immunoglobulin light chain junction region [Macaca mulatta]MOX29750.1 immunoglobulin light chain junction region [Macaca mulatta]